MTAGDEIPPTTSNLVLLVGLESTRAPIDADILAAFQRLRTFGQHQRNANARVFLVFDTGGSFGLRTVSGARAAYGALAGLAKTAAREWSKARIKVIDVASIGRPATSVAEDLCTEILRDDSELELGLSGNGTRIVPRLQPVACLRGSSARSVTPNGVWVVSGGARGVTAHCLQALARRSPQRFVLLGRTSIDAAEPVAARGAKTDAELKLALREAALARGETPTPRELAQAATAILAAREARATCQALQSAGSVVRYEAMDISNAAAVAARLTRIRAEWGPVHGVVHAAGVLADKPLHELNDAQFTRVFEPKVAGFRALLAATETDPLEVLCCFSSVAARVGNVGQAAYATANEALNKLCQAEQQRRGAQCRVRAINWGPWDGGMVSPALKAHFAALGVPLIPLADGAEIFADIVTGELPVAVECVVGGVLSGAPHASAGPLLAS